MINRTPLRIAAYLLLTVSLLSAQERRRIIYPSISPFVRDVDVTAQLLESFVVMQKANAGEVAAQHELGLRYLEGKTVPADTVKGAMWIARAASHGLPMAQFNLGILHNHGWGVAWNPFEAFKSFRAAADQDMDIALYIYGLMYTDGLVVPRDYRKAFDLVKKAAERGYAPAKETVREFIEKKLLEPKDLQSQAAKGADSIIAPVLLSFQTDTSRYVSDTILVQEAFREVGPANVSASMAEQIRKGTAPDSTWRGVLLQAASAGNPEALVALGRFFEHGVTVPRDLVIAATYYFRALRLDSPRAPGLLWDLIHTDAFATAVEQRAKANDPDALYLWAGLTANGFSKLLNEEQALQQLERAVSQDHLPAMIELGLCYLTGRWVTQDRARARLLWERAAKLGSEEARIRLATAVVLGELPGEDPADAIRLLAKASREGSLLAQAGIGYCYEKGIGFSRNLGEAASLYRRAAIRGSQIGSRSLQRMHDEIRPADKEFQLGD